MCIKRQVMYIMNALYFKGEWSYQFDESLTDDKPFYLDDGSSKMVSTMTGKLKTLSYYTDTYRAVEMPYGDRSFSMVVIVPNGSLSDFYGEFTPQVWDDITASLDGQTEWQEQEVIMPKFSFDYEKILNEQLKALGMVDAFSDRVADLTGISEKAPLVVSMVKQNSFVEVNEEGTEAAAVTVVEVIVTGVFGPEPFFINRPFIFAIRERATNTLLFIGGVMDPEG